MAVGCTPRTVSFWRRERAHPDLLFIQGSDGVAHSDKRVVGLARRAARGAAPDGLLAELCSVAVESLEVDGAAVMAAQDGRCRFIWAQPIVFTGFGELQVPPLAEPDTVPD
jgi:hypothetical protein